MPYDNGFSRLDSMRNRRVIAESVFIKFTKHSKFHENKVFCFYEGEDGKYYDQRIEPIFKEDFIPQRVGNKTEVLKLLDIFNSKKEYQGVCKMFFIDRDVDGSLSNSDSNLYETPCYSIENLYATESVFKKVLRSEFGIDITHEDYAKCVNDFQNRMKEFNYAMIEFNAFVRLRRKKTKSHEFDFNKIKTSNLICITISETVVNPTYQESINKIKDGLSNLDITEFEIEECKNNLCQEKDFFRVFRGKNQLDAFVTIIRFLKSSTKKGNYFTQIIQKPKIDITGNRLSELSQYAETPDCLLVFLHKHFEQLQKMCLSSLQAD